MKRDLNVIREVLLEVEALEPDEMLKYDSSPFSDADEGENQPEKFYNALLLLDSGHIRLVLHNLGEIQGRTEYESKDPEYWGVIEIARLTNSGHDLLDSIRDPGILAKVRKELTSNTTLETVQTIANRFILESLGLGS